MGITELQKSQVLTLFGKLFQARDVIHLAHLKTNSYAKHKALNKFYEGIVDLTDTLIESYQGEFGIQVIEIPASKALDPVVFLKSLLETIRLAAPLFKDSDYLNVLDEMKTLIKRTLYKLQYLN